MNMEQGNPRVAKFGSFLAIFAFLLGGMVVFALRWFVFSKRYSIRLGSLEQAWDESGNDESKDLRVRRIEELKLDNVLRRFFGESDKGFGSNFDWLSALDEKSDAEGRVDNGNPLAWLSCIDEADDAHFE